MRRLALVFAVTCVLSTTAMAVDIAISTQAGWWPQTAANTEMQDIVNNVTGASVQLFTSTDHDALATWVKDHTGDGAPDLLILCGILPSTIYPAGNAQPEGSIAELFLDDGNTIISTGDYIFYVTSSGNNDAGGLQNMMDLPAVTMWGDDSLATIFVPTADGQLYTPSLPQTPSNRPWIPAQFNGTNWSVELILAQNSDGTQVHPGILRNSVTDGRIGVFFQVADQFTDIRGEVISEWINNWYLPNLGGANPLARKANPKDKAVINVTKTTATWTPGDFAKEHDVYFGESFEEVSEATPATAGVYVGRQAAASLKIGQAGGVVPTGLIPGKTYYWRIDEIDTADPGSPWKGAVWSFLVRPLEAWKPSPLDGMKNVDPNQDLSWEMGMNAMFRYIYFGKSFDEVNDGIALAGTTNSASHDPGPMDLDTTYYWRIDEVAVQPAFRTTRGPIWSFTTFAPGGGAKAEYFKAENLVPWQLVGDPILSQVEGTIDHQWGEGVVAGGLADFVGARWRANLEVPVTESYTLITSTDDGVRLWLDGRLVIDKWIDQGTTDWTYKVDLVAGQYYMLEMEYYENGVGAVARLSWQSQTLGRQIIPQGWLQLPVHATGPSPAHLDPHANQTPILTWIAGDDATGHDVYFGEDANAVAGADPTTAAVYRGRKAADATSFNPGALEWGKTYYWRVDEITASGVVTGALWSFTTADFLPVDNFEQYNEDYMNLGCVYQTWIDGAGFTTPVDTLGNGSGALVGHPTWDETSPHYNLTTVETSITIPGSHQSMPLYYYNDDAAKGYYSAATRTWSTAQAQNWTVNGVNTLTFFVRGQAGNTAEGLYVTLEDSLGGKFTVSYPDSTAVTSTVWVRWDVPLSRFTGVNATKITKMTIGVGKQPPTAGGTGVIFIDDIRVTKQ